MILKENNPRQAIITSYKRPVLYKDIVLYKGRISQVSNMELDEANTG